MCNSLHGNSISIPKEGTGYKLFEEDRYGNLVQLFNTTHYARHGQTVQWTNTFEDRGSNGDGFCFMLNEDTVRSAKEYWSSGKNVKIIPIKYKGGLGEHKESQFGNHTLALCTEFTVLEGELA